QGKTNKALDSEIKTYNELYRYVLDDFAKAHPDELNLPKYASEMANYITKEFLVKHDKEIKEIIAQKTSGENRQIALNAFENLKQNFDELRSVGIGDLRKPTAKGIKDKIAEIEIKSMSDKELVTQFQKLKDSKARVNENLYKYLENEIKKREKKLYPFINSDKKDYSYDLEKQLKNRGLMGLKDSELENIAKERNSVLYLPSYIRENIEQELNIKPIKEFGTNYAEFYHDGANAIKKLLVERQGQVAGAFYKDGLGDIDLVWGNEKMGLAHILARRSEQWGEEKAIRFINHLAENIEKGTINAGKNGRVEINTELTTIVIDKNKDNRFILTAYRDKNNKKMSLENAKLVQSSTITDKGIETNAKDSSVLLSNQQPNSTPKEIKSQEPTTQPMMNGFSTMAMQKAILSLGSGGIGGVMNANAEQDPNKKAEAFVKGFLLGAGGSVGAMKMLENSAKLAPQLAQVSQRLAKDLPMILNDRPDIVGKALGRTPKDNYNYIFGGENAIGANKAKLKTAQEMAKNGAKDDEIWAKTGWYKDIDGKWKFEINALGGEVKAVDHPFVTKDDFSEWKAQYIDKKLSLDELSELSGGKMGGKIDIAPIARAYNESENINIKELSGKYPNLKMSVADYADLGVYDDYTIKTRIKTVRDMMDGKIYAGVYRLDDILDDEALFKAYPQLKDMEVEITSIFDTGIKGGFNINRNKIILNDNLSKDELKSTLYHELQHAVQKVEGFATGGNSKELGFLEYNRLAGEVEARNEQTRLIPSKLNAAKLERTTDFSDLEKIIKALPKSETNEQIGKELIKLKKQDMLLDEEYGKISAQRDKEIEKLTDELDDRFNALVEQIDKDELAKALLKVYNKTKHPNATADTIPEFRKVVFHSDGWGASYTPKQKEVRGVYNVAFNEKRATQIYKDIEDVENVIKFEKGRADNITANKDGFGSLHIQKHLDPKNEGYITTQEYLNMGEYIRKAGDFKESGGKRVYDYTDENGVRFRAIIGDTRGGKDRVISFFSNRKAGSAYDRQNYTRNQPLSENSTPKEIKSQAQVEQKAKQYAKWLSQADKIPPQA
ncbi:MAG: LPD23 domain-containing protein, partial [Campylobacter lanienae]|nr:hypothetical protein [Campylobacteraceae bacterium]MDY2818426.1 LPD23 domain-containing protein [Campylobacter lanienae]